MKSDATPPFSERAIEFDLQGEFTNSMCVRSGRLWAITSKGGRSVVFSNLKSENPTLIEFPQVKNCLYMAVSDNGQYAFVRAPECNFLLSCDSPKPLLVDGDYKAQKFCWLRSASNAQILFIATAFNKILCIDTSVPIKYQEILAFPLGQSDTINGIHACPISEGRYALFIIKDSSIVPYFLANNLQAVDKNGGEPFNFGRLYKGRSSIKGSDNMISLMTDQAILTIISINPTAQKVTELLETPMSFDFAPESGWIIFNDRVICTLSAHEIIIYQLQKCAKSIKVTEFGRIKSESSLTIDFDQSTNQLYSIHQRSLSAFSPSDCQTAKRPFNLWMAKKSDAINDQPSKYFWLASSGAQYKDLMTGDRFKAMRTLLTLKPSPSIAIYTLELYVRALALGSDPSLNLKDFNAWVTSCLDRHLFNKDVLKKTLFEYGYEDPIPTFFQPDSIFDSRIRAGDTKGAFDILNSIQDLTQFSERAMQIFDFYPEEISKMIIQRGILDIPMYAPFLCSNSASQFMPQFFTDGGLRKDWLGCVFGFHMPKVGNDSLVTQFFRSSFFSPDVKMFTIRCLNASKSHILLSAGLKSMRDDCGAALAAAKADLNVALNVIGGTDDPKIRQRCAIGVLRSLGQPAAGELAQKLLNGLGGAGIDSATLLSFLPDSTHGYELKNTIDSFIADNSAIEEEQRNILSKAQTTIDTLSKMTAEVPPQIAIFPSIDLCVLCGRSLLSMPGTVYPCGHGAHKSCVEAMQREIGAEDNEKDCPVCGLTSVAMVDAPFGKSEKSNVWSTDFSALTAALS